MSDQYNQAADDWCRERFWIGEVCYDDCGYQDDAHDAHLAGQKCGESAVVAWLEKLALCEQGSPLYSTLATMIKRGEHLVEAVIISESQL